MLCREFESRFNDLLDRRRDPAGDSRLAAHARCCDACRELLAGQQALFAGLRHPVAPFPARDFARRVVTATAVARVAPLQSAQRIWLGGGALVASAAAALLALSLVWYARSAGPQVAGQPQPATVPSAQAVPQQTQQLVQRGKRSRRGGLGGGLAATQPGWIFVEGPRWREHYRGAIDNLAVALPQTVERLDEVERLAPGIRPIRISFAMLWDALCRALPGGRSAEPSQPRRDTSWWRSDSRQLA